MTAVEYLFKNMTLYVAYENADTFNKLYEIALEMEKQQKIDFANNYGFDICGYDYNRAEQYYNETYKKDNQ